MSHVIGIVMSFAWCVVGLLFATMLFILEKISARKFPVFNRITCVGGTFLGVLSVVNLVTMILSPTMVNSWIIISASVAAATYNGFFCRYRHSSSIQLKR